MLGLIPRRRLETNVPVSYHLADRFFNELAPSFFKEFWREEKGWAPEFDLSETEKSIVVRADMPGIDAKDLGITVSGNVITVTGERNEEQEEKKEHYHYVERRFGSFSRSFMLPVEVKTEGIEAVYKDGVLTVTIPKEETAGERKIEVKTN